MTRITIGVCFEDPRMAERVTDALVHIAPELLISEAAWEDREYLSGHDIWLISTEGMAERADVYIGPTLRDRLHPEACERGKGSYYAETASFRIANGNEVHGMLPLYHRDGSPVRISFLQEDAYALKRLLLRIWYECADIDLEENTAADRQGREVKTVLFCGLEGGAGTTAAAVSCGTMLDRIYGTKSLYLSLCPRDDSDLYFGPYDTEGSFNRMLFELQAGRSYPLELCIDRRGELARLHFPEAGRDVRSFDAALLDRLTEMTGRIEGAELLLLDIGTQLTPREAWLLERADCVVLVGRGRDFRLHHIRRRWDALRQEAGPEKVITIRNFEEPDPDESYGYAYREEVLFRWHEEDELDPEEETMTKESRDDSSMAPEEDPETSGKALSISWEPAAFIRMGGKIRIELRGNYGLECAACAKKIGEVTGVRNNWPEA